DAPLVEWIYVPDSRLDEDLVLVESDQPTQGARRQLRVEEGRRRSAAGERLVRRQPRGLRRAGALSGGQTFGFRPRPSPHQRFALGKTIGEQEFVMMWVVGVGRLRCGEEVERHDFGALV